MRGCVVFKVRIQVSNHTKVSQKLRACSGWKTTRDMRRCTEEVIMRRTDMFTDHLGYPVCTEYTSLAGDLLRRTSQKFAFKFILRLKVSLEI